MVNGFDSARCAGFILRKQCQVAALQNKNDRLESLSYMGMSDLEHYLHEMGTAFQRKMRHFQK